MDVLSTLPTKESDTLEKLLTIIYEMVEGKLKILKFLSLEIASKAKPSVGKNPYM